MAIHFPTLECLNFYTENTSGHASPIGAKIKRFAWWDRKRFKMIQKWRGDGMIDNFNAFPAVWRPQISIFFSGEACPRTPPPPQKKQLTSKQTNKQSVQPSRIRRECPDFPWESRIRFRLQSGHEYPYFDEQLSQANEQRNIFLLTLKLAGYFAKHIQARGGGGARWTPPKNFETANN